MELPVPIYSCRMHFRIIAHALVGHLARAGTHELPVFSGSIVHATPFGLGGQQPQTSVFLLTNCSGWL